MYMVWLSIYLYHLWFLCVAFEIVCMRIFSAWLNIFCMAKSILNVFTLMIFKFKHQNLFSSFFNDYQYYANAQKTCAFLFCVLQLSWIHSFQLFLVEYLGLSTYKIISYAGIILHFPSQFVCTLLLTYMLWIWTFKNYVK